MPNWFARPACVAFVAAALAGCGHRNTVVPGVAPPEGNAASAGSGTITRMASASAGSAAATATPAPATDSAATRAAAAPTAAAATSAAAPAAPQSAQTARRSDADECLSAARNFLGQDAEVLKCGDLNQHGVLESVAVVRKSLKHKPEDVLATQVMILRRVNAQWVTALDASRGIRNDAGYIATDFVDDAAVVWAYRVKLYRTLPDGDRKFTLEITPVHDEHDGWAVGTEISFDRSVSRYREFNVDGGYFQAENRNPPHLHARKAGTAVARTHS